LKIHTQYLVKPIAMAVMLACAMPHASAQTQSVPRSHSALYYRIGGGSPAARAPNPNAVALKLGIGGQLRLNYTCGKFDIGASWSNLMNGFSQLGTQLTGAVQAGISALPLYILERAQPGLYELFQSYSKKADVTVATALKSCEQMEAEIKAGKDPYAQWIGLAKGQGWAAQASNGIDVVQAKTNVEQNNGIAGVTWIGGAQAGGEFQNPIRPINDLTVAGYNVTINVPVASSNTVNYTNSQLPLAKLFPKPQDAADFATQVLGDLQVSTCDSVSCPNKGAQAGTGLMPRYEAEIPAAQTQLAAVINTSNPSYSNLDQLSAPGVSITGDVIRAIRELPPDMQAIASQRLVKEIALARTIDKALVVRNLLITGLNLPEPQKYDPAKDDAAKRIAALNRYIDDLLFETRVRREIVSETSQALLQTYQTQRATSTATGAQRPVDPHVLSDGRVK
jgi:integrating conjugative element protein (TIGR03755 family)